MIRPRWYRDFLQDFSQLLKAGIPVLEALDSVAGLQGGRRAELARRLAERVRNGSTLGEAMAASPEIPEEHAALTEAGEQSGALDRVLSKLVDRLDREREMLSALVARVAYPVAVVTLAVVLLPLNLLISQGFWAYAAIQISFFGSAAAIIAVCLLAPRALSRSPSARDSFESMLLRVPVLGDWIADSNAGKAFGLLGLLTGAGLALGRSFELVAKTSRWRFLSRAYRSLEKRIVSGKTLAEALALDPFFSLRSEWIARIASSEKAGALEKVFLELGDQLEARTRSRIAAAVRALPFLLLPLVGALILWRALAVFSSLTGI